MLAEAQSGRIQGSTRLLRLHNKGFQIGMHSGPKLVVILCSTYRMFCCSCCWCLGLHHRHAWTTIEIHNVPVSHSQASRVVADSVHENNVSERAQLCSKSDCIKAGCGRLVEDAFWNPADPHGPPSLFDESFLYRVSTLLWQMSGWSIQLDSWCWHKFWLLMAYL